MLQAHYSISLVVIAAAEAQIETSFVLLVEAISNISIFLGGVADVIAEAFAGSVLHCRFFSAEMKLFLHPTPFC